MGLLPRETIYEIHATAIVLGFHSLRNVLLEGINPIFVASLPYASSPASQLLSDLEILNRTERLTDGSAPLEIWLEAAKRLATSRVEAEVFQRGLNIVIRSLPPGDTNIMSEEEWTLRLSQELAATMRRKSKRAR